MRRPARVLRPEERRARQRALGIALGVLLFAALIGSIYAIWMPALRIRTVDAAGPHADILQQLSQSTLSGSYLYLIPHDSIFFYSPEKIRLAALDVFPDIEAVSVRRESFDALSVTAIPRATAFVWCGTAIDTQGAAGTCYDADADGFVFASATPEETNASSTLRIFGPLDSGASTVASPIRAHIIDAAKLPDALRFVKALRDMSIPISALALHDGDEADLWVGGPTRITYILGQEQQAANLAASVLPTLSLTDASIQYVDLRFPGKVYVKRYGQ